MRMSDFTHTHGHSVVGPQTLTFLSSRTGIWEVYSEETNLGQIGLVDANSYAYMTESGIDSTQMGLTGDWDWALNALAEA